MTARNTIRLALAATACLRALAGCHEDRDAADSPESTGTTPESTTSPADAPVADSTAGPVESGCIDDQYGNQSPAAALDLGLDTTDTAFVVLGDGVVASPPEAGADELAVCSEAPSDFFTFTAECPGYLSIEARELEDGGVPDVLLYDGSVAPGSPPLEQALGHWYGFFLKPLQRRLTGGSYVIEVRLRSDLDRQRYSLTVAWLPESPCPA